LKNIHSIAFCILLTAFFAPKSVALKEALGPEGMNVYAVHQTGITGAGVNIGLLSAGNVRDSHTAFERGSGSAVELYDFTGTGLSRSAHDTEMAGIILSGGSQSHPGQIGVAPGARVHSARFSNKQLYRRNIAAALDALIKIKNCRIIMTGIQLPPEIAVSDGNSDWSKLYDYYAETYDVIFASAAGNSFPQITVFGDLYNGITTTGIVKSDPNGTFDTIGSICNPGPTADGRKKPEVAAVTQGLVAATSTGDDHWKTLDAGGRGLTSYAVPHTAGVAALLLEAAAKSPAADDDKTEVIKAVIVNAAEPDLFNANQKSMNPADAVTAWNPDSGYGALNAMGAYDILTAGRINAKMPSKQTRGWAYAVMDKTTSHEYKIPGKKGQRLVVTVTWHRKLKQIATKYHEEPVRFYIDLKLLSPSGKAVLFESAGANNLIKVDHYLKEDGLYSIVLKNPTSVGDRDYGLAFEIMDNGINNAL
jgi:hypothetical protein